MGNIVGRNIFIGAHIPIRPVPDGGPPPIPGGIQTLPPSPVGVIPSQGGPSATLPTPEISSWQIPKDGTPFYWKPAPTTDPNGNPLPTTGNDLIGTFTTGDPNDPNSVWEQVVQRPGGFTPVRPPDQPGWYVWSSSTGQFVPTSPPAGVGSGSWGGTTGTGGTGTGTGGNTTGSGTLSTPDMDLQILQLVYDQNSSSLSPNQQATIKDMLAQIKDDNGSGNQTAAQKDMDLLKQEYSNLGILPDILSNSSLVGNNASGGTDLTSLMNQLFGGALGFGGTSSSDPFGMSALNKELEAMMGSIGFGSGSTGLPGTSSSGLPGTGTAGAPTGSPLTKPQQTWGPYTPRLV